MKLLWTTLAEFPGLIVTLLILEYLGRKVTLAVTITGFSIFAFLVPYAKEGKIFCLFAARAFISGTFQQWDLLEWDTSNSNQQTICLFLEKQL